MDMFAGALRSSVGAPVVNRTNLTGMYALDVHFTQNAVATSTTDASSAGSIPEWATIFTAVQDQLGLKLERHTEMQDVLVIDHIERPTQD
jgi:uncharacterized protein (TIGR03435 family)